MVEKVRSFICLEISDGARREIGRVVSELRRRPADISWVRPESIHLTLKFLGDIDSSLISTLASLLEDVASRIEPFTLRLGGGGAFPNTKGPRVLWVGVEGDLETLNELRSLVEGQSKEHGFLPEAKPFRPHVTIGRVRRPQGSGDVARLLTEASLNAPPFQISEIILMMSELAPGGAFHTPMARALLKC